MGKGAFPGGSLPGSGGAMRGLDLCDQGPVTCSRTEWGHRLLNFPQMGWGWRANELQTVWDRGTCRSTGHHHASPTAGTAEAPALLPHGALAPRLLPALPPVPLPLAEDTAQPRRGLDLNPGLTCLPKFPSSPPFSAHAPQCERPGFKSLPWGSSLHCFGSRLPHL